MSSFVFDGNENLVIQLPDVETGAALGPNISRKFIGLRHMLVEKRAELDLDRRGIKYTLESIGDSPLWALSCEFTSPDEADENSSLPPADFEKPLNVVWRLTSEFGEIDYRNLGRYVKVLLDLTDDQAKEFNALLVGLLNGTATSTPSWVGTHPGYPFLNELIVRYSRGKGTTHVYWPVLTRDASYRQGVNYRPKINDMNILLTSAQVKVLYPEIPQQFKDKMPTNGNWKVERNDWEVEVGGQNRHSIMLTWDEYHDPRDSLDMIPLIP